MPIAAAQCTITCTKSNLTIEWRPGSLPLLDLIEQAGGRAAYSCRYGNCHTCVVDVISGEVAHPPDITPPGDGKMLPCCAAPVSDKLVLVI